MKEVKERKQKLKDEIRLLESGFENRITKAKSNLGQITGPTGYVKKNPIKSVAVAAAAGFTLGLLKRSNKSRSYSNSKSNPRSGISSILMNELKHMAVQKAMYYLSDVVDQQLASRKRSGSENN
ncbi:DUF883 C-terminal domain-containing protein [Rhodohalobacter halophilus]|uniref:DUF883 C-terminal domain-containing protein n=1 Tax=Rhodohalobacter halophilus TaxID=1812810 RepID=UPI00083F91AC|nr:DUF883 C-terminal domain-containing protein [Rhodohalobacter halophilus]